MSHHKQSILASVLVLFGVLAISGGVLVHVVTAQDACPTNEDGTPRLCTIAPDHGVLGNDLITMTGTNLSNGSNTIEWGFGRETTHATGSGVMTISFRLGTGGCTEENPCTGDIPRIGENVGGLVTIRLNNENGDSSNVATFFLMRSAAACYDARDGDGNLQSNPAEVACSDANCDTGNCTEEEEATPTPTATPVPTPTPIVIEKIVEVESDDDDGDGGGGGGGDDSGSSGDSSSSGSSGSVAGATSFSPPTTADKAAADYIPNASVPVVVAKLYKSVYGKDIGVCQSDYWKTRLRSEGLWRESEMLAKMQYHYGKRRDPVYASCLNAQKSGNVAGASTGGAVTHEDINRLFRLANNGVNPTFEQWKYWADRFGKEKRSEAGWLGAMQWHVLAGTQYAA